MNNDFYNNDYEYDSYEEYDDRDYYDNHDISYYSTEYKFNRLIFGLLALFIFGVVLAVIHVFTNISNSLSVSNSDITKSTVKREKLVPTKIVKKNDYFKDESKWIKNNYKLKKSMKYFYETTGVQPYLYITLSNTANSDGNKVTNESAQLNGDDFYKRFFNDDAHLLIEVQVSETGNNAFCIAGSEAQKVMDLEAENILTDYITSYLHSDYSTDEALCKSFEKSADRIMGKTSTYRIFIYITVIAVILLILRLIKKNLKKQR